MITAKEAANLAADYNRSTARTMESVDLPGFKNYKDKIYGSSYFWWRSVYNYNYFVSAVSDGGVSYYNAYNSLVAFAR